MFTQKKSIQAPSKWGLVRDLNSVLKELRARPIRELEQIPRVPKQIPPTMRSG
jgi:hypothetical protein